MVYICAVNVETSIARVTSNIGINTIFWATTGGTFILIITLVTIRGTCNCLSCPIALVSLKFLFLLLAPFLDPFHGPFHDPFLFLVH